MKNAKRITALGVAVLLMTVLCACRIKDGEDTSSETESVSYSGMQNVEAIIAYAERLEAEGDYEAAAQVWALLPASAQDAAAEDAWKTAEDSPQIRAYQMMKEARDIVSAMQNGEVE